LQRVFTVLRSLGPVVVMVDEADAALGSRAGGGDSGISGRVFSMIASQMGDTRYRGKIVWMLLTCRPDLLPIDLKRQGRAEVHIPLFYPHEPEQLTQMLTVMARKNGITLAAREMPDWGSDPQLSGADVESILLSAHRLALAGGRDRIESLDLAEAARRFIPSAQGLEKELQEIVAVLECTDLEFLPPPWEAQIEPPEGRSRLERRLATIRHLVT
jgi:ATP-dependent 26S proteasome regulatory subunit